MPTTLDEIVASTRRKVAARKQEADVRDLERRAENHVPRGFREKLRKTAESGIAIIAELKKASPSRGLIRADFHPETLARDLEGAGAAALSVLTDEEYFQGSLENLRLASATCHLPCLRKDFVVDEFQLLEARANGADAVLLIVAALPMEELMSLARRARALSLDVLCEAHDELELVRALHAGCDVVGVNSRDLRTFKVDLETAFRLGSMIPEHVVSVAESGIYTADDIAGLRSAGYKAFLIGESLMKAEKPAEALGNLLGATGNRRPATAT
jgi:indole-3-glycerol phosphate synthase